MTDVTTEDGVVHQFPDEATPAMIKIALAKYLKPETPPNTAMGQLMPQQMLANLAQTAGQVGGGIGRAAVGALPAAGGILGAMAGAPAGPPGMIAGAALGGTGGEAWRQNINRATGGKAPQTGEEALIRMLGGGAEQGLSEVTGLGVAKGATTLLAKPLMAKALGPGRAVIKNFKNVVGDALKSRVAVGKVFGAVGSEDARALRIKASDRVKQILSKGAQQGIMFDRSQLAQPLIEATEAKLGRTVSPAERAMLIRKVSLRSGQLLTQATSGIKRHAIQGNPVLANEIRRLGRSEAAAAIKGKALGLPPSAIPDLDMHIEEGARRFLNGEVAGYQPAQEAAARSMGVEQAVNAAERAPAQPMAGVGLGGLHVGVGIPPELESRLALLMSNPAIAPFLSNLLRSAGTAGHESMDPAYRTSP